MMIIVMVMVTLTMVLFQGFAGSFVHVDVGFGLKPANLVR
jgi:hypothetical protein